MAGMSRRPDADINQQQMFRMIAIDRAKSTNPGGKRDLKIILGIFGGLILLSVVLLLL